MSRIWRCLLLLLAAICHLEIAQPAPTAVPTGVPTLIPSSLPTTQPIPEPSQLPTPLPISKPSRQPTPAPTRLPTLRPNPSPTPLFDRKDAEDLWNFDAKAWGAFGGDPRFLAILLAAILFVLLLIWIIYKLIQYCRRIHGCTNGFGEPTGLHHIYWGPGDVREEEHIPREATQLSPTARAAATIGAIGVGLYMASQV